MNTTTCNCGNTKDKRSSQCRVCFLGKVGETRVCTKCKQEKSVTMFRYRQRGNAEPRPRPHCKLCESKAFGTYRKRNPEKALASKKAWDAAHPEAVAAIVLRRRARQLGLDPVVIAAHFKQHHGLCDICNQPPVTFKTLSIDHDHATGKFRGLLCSPCNLALGLFKDSPLRLTAALKYLTA